MTIEVGADSAKNPTLVGVEDVKRVLETAELGEDAASTPVMVLGEAELTADDDEEHDDNPEDEAVDGGGVQFTSAEGYISN